MIIPIVSSLLYSTNRRAVLEVIPPELKNLWEEWDLRLTILLSIIIQVILSILGNCRKYNKKSWINLLIWAAYTGADFVTTFALGIVSQNLSYLPRNKCNASVHLDPNHELATVWAQFLLLHLGGPDSITAYALEDNELWLRQLLGLVMQTCGVAYIFLPRSNSRLSVLSIPIFIAGFIKYGERVWVLRIASNKIHRKSVFRSRPEFTVLYDYDTYKDYRLKTEEGHIFWLETPPPEVQLPVDLSGIKENSISDEDKFVTAYVFLGLTRRFLVDGALSSSCRDLVQVVFRNLSMEDAFQVNEIQLGMMYDLLYTKAPLLYSRIGVGLRLFTSLLICSSLVIFTWLDHNNKYSVIDLSITFLLLVVALVLEIYALLVVLSSDWSFLWLIRNQKKISTLKTLASFPLLKSPRWSNTMSQYTLLHFCMKKKPLVSCARFLNIEIKKHQEWTTQVTIDLKDMIFWFFEEKADELATTGKIPFTALNIEEEQSTRIENDFEYIITLWSIVTELSYILDRAEMPQNFLSKRRIAKRVSRYVLYLLVNHPSTISAETGLMPFSFEDIAEFFLHQCPDDYYKLNATEMFLPYIANNVKNGTISNDMRSMFITALELVEKLRQQPLRKRWEELAHKWLEMLAFTARRSKGNEHARHLGSGGEFLTHVWLLMAHFGLTHHFRIAHQGANQIPRLITV